VRPGPTTIHFAGSLDIGVLPPPRGADATLATYVTKRLPGAGKARQQRPHRLVFVPSSKLHTFEDTPL